MLSHYTMLIHGTTHQVAINPFSLPVSWQGVQSPLQSAIEGRVELSLLPRPLQVSPAPGEHLLNLGHLEEADNDKKRSSMRREPISPSSLLSMAWNAPTSIRSLMQPTSQMAGSSHAVAQLSMSEEHEV